MKYRLALPLIAFLIIPLPACSALDTAGSAITGSVSSVSPDTVNKAKQALTAAHNVHRVTADFLAIAAETNLCHAACATQARAYLNQSEAALVAADKAVELGDAVGAEAKITTATSLISQINQLVGKK